MKRGTLSCPFSLLYHTHEGFERHYQVLVAWHVTKINIESHKSMLPARATTLFVGKRQCELLLKMIASQLAQDDFISSTTHCCLAVSLPITLDVSLRLFLSHALLFLSPSLSCAFCFFASVSLVLFRVLSFTRTLILSLAVFHSRSLRQSVYRCFSHSEKEVRKRASHATQEGRQAEAEENSASKGASERAGKHARKRGENKRRRARVCARGRESM